MGEGPGVRAGGFVTKGGLKRAQQFAAGTASTTILCDKSRRDGRNQRLKFDRPHGTKTKLGPPLPSDKSLGYYHASLWDERILATHGVMPTSKPRYPFLAATTEFIATAIAVSPSTSKTGSTKPAA